MGSPQPQPQRQQCGIDQRQPPPPPPWPRQPPPFQPPPAAAKTVAAMAGQWVSKVDLYFSPKYAERAEALAAAIERNGGYIVHTK